MIKTTPFEMVFIIRDKMTSLTEILGVLCDRGLVAWRADFAADECHEMISLISDNGAEVMVDLWLDSERQTLFVERFLTDSIDLTKKAEMVSLLYIALATANMELCESAHIGICHLYARGEFHVIYSNPVPLFSNAELAAALVQKSLSAISVVEPFFKTIEEQIRAGSLTTAGVVTFQTLAIDIHPMLKISPQARTSFNAWLESTSLAPIFYSLFKNTAVLDIYHCITDKSISVHASNGMGESIKLDEFEITRGQVLRDAIEKCWDRYVALAAFLGAARSDIYTNSDAFLDEIEAALEC